MPTIKTTQITSRFAAPQVWVAYIDFVLGLPVEGVHPVPACELTGPDGEFAPKLNDSTLVLVRDICERAVASCGMHPVVV